MQPPRVMISTLIAKVVIITSRPAVVVYYHYWILSGEGIVDILLEMVVMGSIMIKNMKT